MSASPADAIPKLAQWLRESRYTTVFSGAGASTESGLPDFRSNGGLWRQNRRFEELASIDALRHEYPEFVAFYRWRLEGLAPYAPHVGHRLLAEWQRRGLVHALITQNVDGFHQQAGSRDVAALHGDLRAVRCHDCDRPHPTEHFFDDVGLACEACGGRLRPGVVLFGETLPEAAWSQAQSASERCELFLVLGSSLAVSPANYLPQLARARGAKLAILNDGPTALDDCADWRLEGRIGPTLEAIEACLLS